MTQFPPEPSHVTILVVDDEPGLQLAFRLVLELENFQVLTSSSVDEALTMLTQHPVDLLITDFRMPHRNGLDLISEIRRESRSLPCILCSAYLSPDLINTAQELGVDQILHKPVSTEQLRCSVEEAMN